MMGPPGLVGVDTRASQALPVQQSRTGIWEERSSRRRLPCGASLQSSVHQRRGQSTAKHQTLWTSTSGRHQTASTLCAEDTWPCTSGAASVAPRAASDSSGLLSVTESRRSGQSRRSRRPGALSSSSALIQRSLPFATAATMPRRLPLGSRKLPSGAALAMAQEGEREDSDSQPSLEVDHSMMRRALELAVSCKGKYKRSIVLN